jgi:RNA polymerase sigma factor (sigma-70 family)
MAVTWTSMQNSTQRAVQNSAAFDTLVQTHWNRICEALFRLTGDWDEAEDLALETFMRLYQNPPEDTQNLTGWLYRVATNLGLNALRSQKRRRFYESQVIQDSEQVANQNETLGDPAQIVEQDQERQRVRLVLSQMKLRPATLLLLRYSGLSYQEIADTTGVAPGSVGKLLARAEKEFERRYRHASK